MRRIFLLIVISMIIVTSLGLLSFAAGPPISSMTLGNKHNLSSLNTSPLVRYKATPSADPRSNQICVFCHTPHNSAPLAVLWNRRDPTRTFGHYSSVQLVIDDADMRAKTQYGEPTGSARLCLSCHDGETALGAVLNGPEIAFPVGYTKVGMMNYSGHHPVSFVYDQEVLLALSQRRPLDQFKLPLPDSKVKLDKQQRMQCTACHDPHQDWSDGTEVDGDGKSLAPFWVDKKHDDVCLVCHNLVQNP